MGHKNIETMLGIYRHVNNEVYNDVAYKLDGIYKATIDGDLFPQRDLPKPQEA